MGLESYKDYVEAEKTEKQQHDLKYLEEKNPEGFQNVDSNGEETNNKFDKKIDEKTAEENIMTVEESDTNGIGEKITSNPQFPPSAVREEFDRRGWSLEQGPFVAVHENSDKPEDIENSTSSHNDPMTA